RFPYTTLFRSPRRSRAGPRPCQGARGHFPLGHGTGRLTMLRSSSASGGAIIRGFGEYQPGRVITNADLASRIDTTDEWIQSRVGIKERRVGGPEETVASMAIAAGGKALAASGMSPADIDLVIVATCTVRDQIPNTAATVAAELGVVAPGAF